MSDVPGRSGPVFSSPSPLTPEHDVAGFGCVKATLDDWLKHRASKAEGRSARTYVICEGFGVIGYYCLATGGTSHLGLSGSLRRNMPDPAPMMVLGRLAVDARYQGRGLGSALLRDAMARSVEANRIAGFRALAVHAKDDEALAFYLQYGFLRYPQGTRTMFLPIETLLAALQSHP